MWHAMERREMLAYIRLQLTTGYDFKEADTNPSRVLKYFNRRFFGTIFQIRIQEGCCDENDTRSEFVDRVSESTVQCC